MNRKNEDAVCRNTSTSIRGSNSSFFFNCEKLDKHSCKALLENDSCLMA